MRITSCRWRPVHSSPSRRSSSRRLDVGAGFFVCGPWVTPRRAEIVDGSGFEVINWNMHIADAERVIGSGVSRLRENTHSDYEYLRAAHYQYLGCQYVLLLNFGPNG